ncbi:MAG TPA: squalene synthase HpnC [Caulobacteraceae bacterium]|nr:squalene synthase HpnC [Caulobacteraceae bacterium]
MSDIEDLASGKGSGDENFPVASALIAPKHRPVVLAFYRVARLSDDVADHPVLTSAEKLERLDAVEASLTGADDGVPAAAALRRVLAERGLTDRHMLDLLTAFRRDAVKSRYADWGDLMDYCRYSAAPVGRFVLDVHGEARSTWPASDALCAALQVINHLQDCGKDYRDLDRVYIPRDALAAEGLDARDLGEAKAGPALRRVIAGLAGRTSALLAVGGPLAGSVRDLRLSLEIGVIHTLAESLVRRLMIRDPLSQKVHHSRAEAVGVALRGAAATLAARLSARPERQAEA